MNPPFTNSDVDLPTDYQRPGAAVPDRIAAGESAELRILELIRRGEKFLVTSHSRPDGDAVGSMLAMGMLLRQMGKRADLVTADRIPQVYRRLPESDTIRAAMRVHGPYDAAILLECDGLERAKLRGMEDLTLVNIDHHVSGRDFGHINWIDCQAASVGEMVYRLLKAAGGTLTPEIATCLYTLRRRGRFRAAVARHI